MQKEVIDNEEKEYVFYFDLYKLEGADVFNAFKNAIEKELGYKNIKYTLKQVNANAMQPDDVPNIMTGGDSNATFPYNIFENSIDSIRGVGEEERKSIFDGLFTRQQKSEEEVVSKPLEPSTSEEPSNQPKKKGFFNFDFSVINIFKKTDNHDIKPTVIDESTDVKEKNVEDGDIENEEEGADEEDQEEDEEDDISQEMAEGNEMPEENKINENIITVELTIKCIDKKLCMPVILDIKKTMFMK